MKLSSVALSLPVIVSAAVFKRELNIPAPEPITVHVCGDSTAGSRTGGAEGWGHVLKYSFNESTAIVNNAAIGGRSSRSFTREGRFQRVADSIIPGDWVIIEFGHNDEGQPETEIIGKGRTVCPGFGDETCIGTYNNGTANVTEIVYTYHKYVTDAAKLMFSKGAAGLIISGPTSRNTWQTGTWEYETNIFTTYAQHVTESLGGAVANVFFVPHGPYCAQAQKNLGFEKVDTEGYVLDNTHTQPWLADIVHQAFILGLKCEGQNKLVDFVKNGTVGGEGTILGGCII